MASKTNINEYKDRMTSPIGAVRISPKTGKPLKPKTTTTKGKK